MGLEPGSFKIKRTTMKEGDEGSAYLYLQPTTVETFMDLLGDGAIFTWEGGAREATIAFEAATRRSDPSELTSIPVNAPQMVRLEQVIRGGGGARVAERQDSWRRVRANASALFFVSVLWRKLKGLNP